MTHISPISGLLGLEKSSEVLPDTVCYNAAIVACRNCALLVWFISKQVEKRHLLPPGSNTRCNGQPAMFEKYQLNVVIYFANGGFWGLNLANDCVPHRHHNFVAARWAVADGLRVIPSHGKRESFAECQQHPDSKLRNELRQLTQDGKFQPVEIEEASTICKKMLNCHGPSHGISTVAASQAIVCIIQLGYRLLTTHLRS